MATRAIVGQPPVEVYFGEQTYLALAAAGRAEDAEAKAQGWAEGTEPGGPGTKSAKEYSEDAATTFLDMQEFFEYTAQTIGRPTGSPPVAGSANISTAIYVFATAIAADTVLQKVRLYAAANGVIRVSSWQKSGDNFTRVGSTRVRVTAGANDITLAQPFAVAAGLRIGVEGSGIIMTTVAAADSGGIYSGAAAGAASGAFTDATVSSSLRFEIGLDFDTLEEGGYIDNRFARIENGAATNHTIGRYGTPTAGTVAAANRVYVLSEPMPQAGVLKRIRAYARASGTWSIRRFTKSGDVFTQIGTALAVTMVSGQVNTIDLGQPFTINAGEYIGFFPAAGAAAAGADYESTFSGYYDNAGAGGGDSNSFTDAAASIGSTTLQIGFDFFLYEADTFDAFMLSQIGSGGEAATAYPFATEALNLLWLIGESHPAGRALAFSSAIPTGRGWCYRRATTSIAHLADPTGNDATAISGSGRGSFGPSIGQALLDATHGAVGALIVNSGYGSTLAGTNWGTAGNAWTQAKADWDAAITAIKAAKIPIAGVTIVVSIGSNDATAGTAKATYKAALLDMISRAVAYANAGDVPVAIVQTGPYSDGSAAAAVLDVQKAQAEIVRENDGIYMATSAPKFALEKGWFQDTVHFNQTGNDAIGPGIAAVALAHGSGFYPAGLE